MSAKWKQRLPLGVFLGAALLGGIGAAAIWMSAAQSERLRFARIADEATNRVAERVRLHLLLIEATAAMFEAQPDLIAVPRFATYFDELALAERNPGIAGLGFASFASAAQRAAVAAGLVEAYGPGTDIWPHSAAPFLAPVILIGSPDPEPPPAVGFDMYTEPLRRRAIDAAIAARAPQATEPLRLATDTRPSPGFIVYAPVYAAAFGLAAGAGPQAPPTGFAFGGFRVAELVEAAVQVLPYLPLALTVADADSPEDILYSHGAESFAKANPDRSETRAIDVVGQTWTLTFRPTGAFEAASGRGLAFVFAAITLALAAAAALAVREQFHARATAEALAQANARNLAEKDMLLQEMKHRIKNAIARILAIARQTAAQSADLPGFTASFTRRLQAMATAQDMLSRSAQATADLRQLLTRELAQVFGDDLDDALIEGPPVVLSAAQTQALGLVFHELATNALKYGGGRDGRPQIHVVWQVSDTSGTPALHLAWTESGGPVAPPEATGFGAQLIDANLRLELGGTLERRWTLDGLAFSFRIPLGRS